MPLSGNLRTMDLAELLQWIGHGGKNGTLSIERERLRKLIGFRNGMIVSVESNDPSEHLGQFLLSYGKIDPENLKRAFAMQEKVGLKLGEILVEVNLLRADDIANTLRIQAVEIVYNLFLWEDAVFHFDDTQEAPVEKDLSLDPNSLIMEGVYRYDEWTRYREVFPTDDILLELVPEWKPESDEDKELAVLVEAGKTIGELCFEFRTSKFHTYGRLYELYSKGSLRLGTQPVVESQEPVSAEKVTERSLEDIFQDVLVAVRERKYETALPWLEDILARGKSESEDRELVAKAEQTYKDILLTRYIDPHKIPRVTLPPALLTEKKFNPAEGYLISRIDGSWDVASIIRISPIPESEALGIFKRFVDEKIIMLT